MLKILVLNSRVDFKSYFENRGLECDVVYREYKVKPPLVYTGKGMNSNGSTFDTYSPDVAPYLRGFINANEYHFVIFGYETSWYGPEVRFTGGKAFREELFVGTHYATMRLDGNEDLYVIHELMHLMCYSLQAQGYPVVDQMDQTMVNGKLEYYYKNDDPEQPDGNHARTWKSIEPYKKFLDDFAPLLKRGMKMNWVTRMQMQLRTLGYWYLSIDGDFGPLTDRAIKQIQKDNFLNIDGIVGGKTLSALVKKKYMEDLSKWKLLPLIERKAADFLEKCQLADVPVRITSGYRSIEEQNKLYAQGRTTPGNIVTNAKGGDSFHNWRVAFDVCFKGDVPYPPTNTAAGEAKWQKIGKIGEDIGLSWGGPRGEADKFTFDRPHFELTLGYKTSDFKSGKVNLSKFN